MTGDEKRDDEKKHGELRTNLLSGWRRASVLERKHISYYIKSFLLQYRLVHCVHKRVMTFSPP